MSYCPYCGREVSSDMSFCPGCGAALSKEVKTYTVTDSITSNSGDYKIYISSLGTADKYDVVDLLEDVLGYTETSAWNLIENIPVQIAGNLSLKQAAVVAQAFEEYGVELSVTNGDEYEDISSSTSSTSLFNSDGSFLSSAAIILATIGAANRLRSIVKPRKPSLLERIFHSLFGVPRRRPVHVRRRIRPRNMSFPRVEPQPRRVVRQQLNPFGMSNNKRPASNNHYGGFGNKKPSTSGGNNKPSMGGGNKPSIGMGNNKPSKPSSHTNHGGTGHSRGGHKG
ncbi:MAG: zinc ribbon domain-containing protein [Erysipelotrichaceae bacterium]|nr:zinc ribbon domain-containing protein [Erysipelotrichaceae bacterium]